MQNAFNKIKNTVYNENINVVQFSDLVELIQKENKSEEDVQTMKNIYKNVSILKDSINNLGNKILDLNGSRSGSDDGLEINGDNLDAHTRDIVLCLDDFIDAVAALNKIYNFKESRIELAMIEELLKMNRASILDKSRRFKQGLSIRPDLDIKITREEYIKFLEDIIDIVTREAMKLSVLKIHKIIKNKIDLEETKKNLRKS